MGKLLQIEDKIFTDSRLRLWSCGGIVIFCFLLGIVAFVTVFQESGIWPFLANGRPRCIDFGWIWLSGKFAVAGDATRVFDFPAWSAVQDTFFNPGGNCINFNRFYYPPTFLFLTYPFGLMPYVIALAVWIIGSFVLYQAAVYAIIPRRTTWVVAASLATVIFSNVSIGHTGFLTAALMGLSLVSMERRPWLSGVFLGLLTYKPHFGVLFPIALLASRNWRALGSAVLVTAVLCVLAAMAFGYEGWVQFFDALSDRNSGLGPAPGVAMRLQSIFGMFDLVGASTSVSWGAQLVVSAIVAFGIWILWAKPISFNLKVAALCAGSLLASPYALFYDLTILAIGAAFFIKEGLSRGFLPGERMGMVICWFVLIPIWWRGGPVVAAIILCLIARRMVVFRRSSEPVLGSRVLVSVEA